MKKSIYKKIAVFLSAVIFAAGITGCGSGSKNENKGSIRGGYVESKVDLPEDAKNEFIIEMDRSDNGHPILYTCNNDSSKTGIYKYEHSESGQWEKENIEWLADMSVPLAEYAHIITGDDGQEYFTYGEDINGWMYKHLFKKTAENTAEEIKLEGWELSADDPDYDCPSGIKVLKDGNYLVMHHGGDRDVFDKETYKKISQYSVPETDVDEPKTIIRDDKIICFTGNGKDQQCDSITYYDEDFKELDKIEFDKPKKKDLPQDFYIDDDSITMFNSDGIHITNPQTKIWETIVEGDTTSISSPSLWETDMIKGNDKEYYVLFYTSDNTFELLKYAYDSSASKKIDNEISIYALSDNITVREVVTVFQRKHPEVKVNFRVSIDKDENENPDIDKSDYIKTLNTQMLSGSGPDILILDDMPINSYIEKGGLADISDIINPMADNNELLPNIAEDYKKDNKIYCIPARYDLPIVYGNTQAVNSASSLDEIVNFSNNNKGMQLFGRTTYGDLVKQFLPVNAGDFYDGNKTLDKEKLAEFLSKVKTIGDNSGALMEYDKDEGMSNSYSLASDSKIILKDSKSIYEADFEIAVVNYINGSFTSYENSYVPKVQVGINASSKEIDLCKEFIKIMLSTDVQDKDNYDGFPVNIQSLDNWNSKTGNDSMNAETEIENADGSYSPLYIRWPEKQQIESIIDMCKNASNKTISDDVLFNIIVNKSENFFRGNITSEECADLISTEAEVYLSE